MFNIGNILKRAWQILWSYKILWAFAFLLAISGGAASGGGGGGGGSSSISNFKNEGIFQDRGNAPEWASQFGDWAEQNIAPLFATEEKTIQTVIWFVVIIALISIVTSLILALVRYPSETAVMRMVDEHEQNGTKYRFKQAWKLGWNRRAWRMFLIDLLIGAPAFTVVMLLVGTILLIAFGFREDLQGSISPGLVIGFIFFMLFIFVFALFMAMVSLLRQYVARFNAIDDCGVWESFRRGWKLFKGTFKHTFLMWLVMIGVGIAFGFVSIVAVFLLIPAYALLAIPGAVAAVIPGGIAYGITTLFSQGALPWIIGALVALPFLLVVVFSPIAQLSGMFAVFTSNVWTLMFRQMKANTTPPPALEIPELPQADL